jgi:hypothetical protein
LDEIEITINFYYNFYLNEMLIIPLYIINGICAYYIKYVLKKVVENRFEFIL